jgi:hypothetical protein
VKPASILVCAAIIGALLVPAIASAVPAHGVATIVAATGTAKQTRDLSWYGTMKVHWQATCPPATPGAPLLWFILFQVTGAHGKPAPGLTGGAVAGQQSIVGMQAASGTLQLYVVLDKGVSRETFHASLTLLCSGKHIPLVGKPAFTLNR